MEASESLSKSIDYWIFYTNAYWTLIHQWMKCRLDVPSFCIHLFQPNNMDLAAKWEATAYFSWASALSLAHSAIVCTLQLKHLKLRQISKNKIHPCLFNIVLLLEGCRAIWIKHREHGQFSDTSLVSMTYLWEEADTEGAGLGNDSSSTVSMFPGGNWLKILTCL